MNFITEKMVNYKTSLRNVLNDIYVSKKLM